MSVWFLIVILIILLSSVMIILIRIESRDEIKRLENEDFSADDFEIIED